MTLVAVNGSAAAVAVVLRGRLSNPAPSLVSALAHYRQLGDLRDRPVKPRLHAPHHRLQLISPKEVDELVAGYEAGATARQLAVSHGWHRHTVERALRSRGIQSRLRSLTEIEAHEVVALYAQGLSIAQVAERIGRSSKLVLNTLRRAGVATRDTHGRERPRQ